MSAMSSLQQAMVRPSGEKHANVIPFESSLSQIEIVFICWPLATSQILMSMSSPAVTMHLPSFENRTELTALSTCLHVLILEVNLSGARRLLKDAEPAGDCNLELPLDVREFELGLVVNSMSDILISNKDSADTLRVPFRCDDEGFKSPEACCRAAFGSGSAGPCCVKVLERQA